MSPQRKPVIPEQVAVAHANMIDTSNRPMNWCARCNRSWPCLPYRLAELAENRWGYMRSAEAERDEARAQCADWERAYVVIEQEVIGLRGALEAAHDALARVAVREGGDDGAAEEVRAGRADQGRGSGKPRFPRIAKPRFGRA